MAGRFCRYFSDGLGESLADGYCGHVVDELSISILLSATATADELSGLVAGGVQVSVHVQINTNLTVHDLAILRIYYTIKQ